MLRLAGAIADRVVVNLVTPAQARGMVEEVAAGARAAGRAAPPVAAWMATGSEDGSRERVTELLHGYVRAPGYRERFEEAGLLEGDRLLPTATDQLAAFGTAEQVAERVSAYARAGVSEVALVVSGQDPAGREIVRGTTALFGESSHA